jgi:arylsulfatase A-like enzyme
MIIARFCRFVAIVSTATLLSASGAETPNILFIFMDDYGWKDLGFMGSDFYETPNLDRLASEGMIFTDAYSCAANCAPARASLLSGQYTPRHEVFNVGTGARGPSNQRKLLHIPGTETLRPDITTWAQQIQKAGYVTATMGKWHLSADPIPYGFDVNIGGTHSGGPPKGYFPPHGDVPGLADAPDGEYVTDRLSDEAIKFIHANQERPWLLYLTHFAVHTPIQGKEELVAKYEKKTPGAVHDHPVMAAMIESVDQGVGRILDALNDLGLAEDTVVIFFSDNGGYGPATDMAPLKGYKGTYYEGGIRVPFFVRWPGVVDAGSASAVPIIGVDLYPTLCEIAGAELPEGQDLDGCSLVPLFEGRGGVDRNDDALFWHFPAYLQSYGGEYNREQRDPYFRSRPCGIVRVGDWKLHEYFEDGELELYNLKEDIGETNNRADEMPEKVAELHALLKEWRAEIKAPVPSEANPEYRPDATNEDSKTKKKKKGKKQNKPA